MTRILSIVSLLVVGGVFSNLAAQERRLERKDLPAAVEAVVARESSGATVKGFSTERENGIRTYEAEFVINGRSKDVSMDSKGNILEIEEQVDLASLPDSVRAALTKAAGSGRITKIESLTKKEKLVAYEAVITTGKKHREVQIGPNGEKLKREE